MKVTQDDLLDALRKALGSPSEGDGLTMAELSAAMGCSDKTVLKGLRSLSSQGRLEVSRVRRTSIVGVSVSVPAYRIKSP